MDGWMDGWMVTWWLVLQSNHLLQGKIYKPGKKILRCGPVTCHHCHRVHHTSTWMADEKLITNKLGSKSYSSWLLDSCTSIKKWKVNNYLTKWRQAHSSVFFKQYLDLKKKPLNRLPTEHKSWQTLRITKAVFYSAAISKQLNPAPYLCDVHEP